MKERDGEGEAVPTDGKTMRHKKKTAVGGKGKTERKTMARTKKGTKLLSQWIYERTRP